MRKRRRARRAACAWDAPPIPGVASGVTGAWTEAAELLGISLSSLYRKLGKEPAELLEGEVGE